MTESNDRGAQYPPRKHYMELVNPPPNRKVLKGKWVYKIKRGPTGDILRHKARWVVKGYAQIDGIDYNETFASVVKPMSYKALFAVAAAEDWEIDQMDVVTAFLYGEVEEEIYVQQPTGREQPNAGGKVCKLIKALYGLKQAPRVLFHRLTTYLQQTGFAPLTQDHSVFVNKSNTFIDVYVDDLLLFGPDGTDINQTKSALNTEF
jgi:hypothetical protein